MTASCTLSRLLHLGAAALLTVGLVACGDDEPTPPADTTADTTPPEDTVDEDQTAPDTVDADLIDPTDPDVPAVCESPCLNELGRNDRRLCPTPISDWRCVDGCCLPAFRCEDDADCRREGYELGQCPDGRFDCRCEVSSGICSNWFCAIDDDCGEGERCVGGGCVAEGDGPLTLRLIGPEAVVLPVGFGHTVLVDGTRMAEDVLVAMAVEATFTTGDATVATVDAAGRVQAVGQGQATITASLGESSVTVLVTVLPVEPTDTLTVATYADKTLEPIVGTYAIVGADGATLAVDDIPSDGVIRFADNSDEGGAGPYDLHIFAEEHDWVSHLGLAAGEVLSLPMSPAAYGRIASDMAGEIVADETTLSHVGILRGTPDFGDYFIEGALEIVLTSGALSNALFDFSLPVLLGADVRRFISPGHTIPRVDATEELTVPGGIVFNLVTPAIPDFMLAAPRGNLPLWSLGGRLDINEVAEYSGRIIDALAGGRLDFTQVVGAVFPLFRNFWSGYNPTLRMETVGDPGEVLHYDPELTTPMGVTTRLFIPKLPNIGELGYADALFLLGGAQTADGFMVPLGLNGGADTSDPELNPPDGFADGNERTPELEPFTLPMASLHSGLQGPHTGYLVVAVAVSIPTGGGDPRPSAGSATLVRYAPGERPVEETQQPDFLPFPTEGSFDPAERTVRWSGVEGTDLERVLVKGRRGRHWTVYGSDAPGLVRFPDPQDFGVDEDRLFLDGVESLLINSIDFAEAIDPAAVGRAEGAPFELLLTVVDRVSFIDVKNARPPAP